MAHEHFEDDGPQDQAALGKQRRFGEFDCPDCNANNPAGDGVGDGDSVICAYCGSEYAAAVDDEGRLSLTEA